MERIKGLNEYVKNEKYRKALNLPNEQEEEYTMLAQESIILITASRIQRQEKTSVTCQLWESDASGKSDRV